MSLSPEELQVSAENSKVLKFYRGRSLLITGATGYLGVVLLEVLLRCCPDIARIYILLRPKKGVLAADRKEDIFKKQIFFKIKEKNPNAFEKVTVISGDITREHLGMSNDDLLKVIQEVSVVFHCAASISFMKPLRFMVLNNVIATNNVVELCRKLKKLDVFVYTSTAYSCSNRVPIVGEKIYEMPFAASKAVNIFRKGSDEELENLYTICNPKFPNYYTFSKCLAENFLAEEASDLPVVIVRPSIIISCWKSPLPGYVEGESGMVGIGLGIGKGFLRVLLVDGDKKIDAIPADIVASTHVLAAWQHATEKFQSPIIYNCVSSYISPCTWNDYVTTLATLVSKNPLPRTFRKPYIKLCRTEREYWFLSMFYHYMPAVVIDAILYLAGKKPRLLPMYRFFDKVVEGTKYFMLNETHFECQNFLSLSKKIDAEEEELFPVDMSNYSTVELARDLPTGAPFYQWNGDKKTMKQRLRLMYMRHILTSFIQMFIVGCFFLLLYVIIF